MSSCFWNDGLNNGARSAKRLFAVGETLAWDFRLEDAYYLRSMIREGRLPDIPVVTEVRDAVRDKCPVCGSPDTSPHHDSRRIDGPSDGCEWDGIWSYAQHVRLQNGVWMTSDWFL